MDLGSLSLTFSAGFLAILAPCALPMLPSYVAYYMNVEETDLDLKRSLVFAFTTVLGFLTVFLVIGLLPSFAINIVAERLVYITPLIGGFLIIIGLVTGFSSIMYRIPSIPTKAPQGLGVKNFYLYGLGYGAASLTCSFPIFVLLVLQTATAGGPLDMLLMFTAYGLGAATLMVPLTLALTYSKEQMHTRVMNLLPHIKKINALILVAAGLYMIATSILN
ncbi:MAG: hypothetical protein NWE89_12485 [Candidatus Bathyarchaeota archaeon]|nr:hypothetical protein [Candidatus Bathyarchaeota archaeon]